MGIFVKLVSASGKFYLVFTNSSLNTKYILKDVINEKLDHITLRG